MKRVLLPILFLFAATAIDASAQAGVRGEGGISFALGFPSGEFGDQIDGVGFGGRLFGAIGFGDSPVLVGIEGGYMNYGRERRNEPFSTTIPDVTVDVTTTNNLAGGHLFLRLQPANTRMRPYADALFGFKYLFTETRITNEGFGEENVAHSTNFDDTALSYGVGGGVQIQVWDGSHKPDAPSAVYVDLGVRYLFGREASYLKEGSIKRENGQVTFEVTESKTDILVAQIGIGLRF